MIAIESGNPKGQFLAFIHHAVSFLAEEKYGDFINIFDKTRMNINELILALQYLDDERPAAKIDSPDTISDAAIYIIQYNDGRGYAVDYDLMTDGEWNDLTLQVEFLVVNNMYRTVLEDLHTL